MFKFSIFFCRKKAILKKNIYTKIKTLNYKNRVKILDVINLLTVNSEAALILINAYMSVN